MKFLQNNFKCSAVPFAFIGIAVCVLGFLLFDYDSSKGEKIFNFSILFVGLCLIYKSSFIYEFRQKEIIVYSLWGIYEDKKCYQLTDIKKVEYLSGKGKYDKVFLSSVTIYFKSYVFPDTLYISLPHSNIHKIKPFLFAQLPDINERSTHYMN